MIEFFTHSFDPLSACDPSLGRLDYDSLSDQALMEMLIDGMHAHSEIIYLDENRNYKDVCEWYRIECTDERVTKVAICYQGFSTKPFPFHFTPPLVTTAIFSDCGLHGTLDGSHLPLDLEQLGVQGNSLSGAIDFKSFPRKMKAINLSFNEFSGECAFSDLPDTLENFAAPCNKFCGELSLNSLPAAMMQLDLSLNDFSGPVRIESLPEAMRFIDLSTNKFLEEFTLLAFPPNFEGVRLAYNPLIKTIVLRKASGKMPFYVSSELITSVLDDEGKRHSWEMAVLEWNIDSSDDDCSDDDSY